MLPSFCGRGPAAPRAGLSFESCRRGASPSRLRAALGPAAEAGCHQGCHRADCRRDGLFLLALPEWEGTGVNAPAPVGGS